MKYIVTTRGKDIEEMFVFPDSINHDCMTEVLGRIKNHTRGSWERVIRRPISAGFITVEGKCYGRSETLNLDSRSTTDTVLFDMECKNQ